MRQSGILMHITSLPGRYGIGTMGKEAYKFVDFLQEAGQSCWQILPLSPTGFGDSPYQALSSCAGNHYLVDLDLLVKEGLLKKAELKDIPWGSNPGRVDFGAMYRYRTEVLKLAFRRFTPDEGYQSFVKENEDWLEDYALFMALKERYGDLSWLDWPEGPRLREETALAEQRETLDETIRLHKFLQYRFSIQWNDLRAYANKKGIRIIGDVPIYVPLDSADVWANPELFQLDENRRPVKVAGCPPDGFTADGQLWGNPLYNWEKLADTGYGWWIRRLRQAAKLYDMIRIDHFRGFESYWAVPYGDKTARNGTWEKGPGMDFFHMVHREFPELAFIAEDLGFVTPEVRQLQIESGYPGMKVLEFAFDSREESDYLPHLYPVDSVCYTGTHDNLTLKQWFREAAPRDVAYAKAYLGLNRWEGYNWGVIRGGMGSVSELFIAQMQDYLGLGKEGRMNLPGSVSPDNWTWRAKKGFASRHLQKKLYDVTKRYGRVPSK